ncbi:Transcriptional regulator, AbiEi antitoxin, Type IV TA system [Jatrophihabitans endophyticus]|uniref:Transcriptional regulator, AbiEi antitoxin, Type IV TA system n=1 Tax=Jatrophihabitans endophyticus TaxID=1206085 RepID=A0A1M5N587_9ACTN|nr:type IV toxin-antitoxin system AbiEi family antitoxin domain-containing protein [Jatrophihabitans endophyticus]SHG84617.1 Transcriptional regulator, AbiEi antitoxin, Type IV TA system [Jatrophihabitans endophyticus]
MRALPTATVFSRADARAAGWSDPALTRAVRSGRVLRLRRDQFTVAAGPVVAAVAAARGCSGSVVSHRSAALVHGLPLVGPPPPVPEVTVAPNGTGDLHRAHLYRATLRDVDVVEVDGLAVTSVARTLADLGRHHPTTTAVAAADHALHHELTTPAAIADAVQFCTRWPGGARAVRSLASTDARSESPLESISRIVIRRLGLPSPVLQQRIRDPRGIVIARLDFYWDEFGVAGEADGRAKFARDADVGRAWDRHVDLDDLGLQLVRWGWATVTRTPRLLETRIREAFRRGLRRDALGLPRRWGLADS